MEPFIIVDKEGNGYMCEPKHVHSIGKKEINYESKVKEIESYTRKYKVSVSEKRLSTRMTETILASLSIANGTISDIMSAIDLNVYSIHKKNHTVVFCPMSVVLVTSEFSSGELASGKRVAFPSFLSGYFGHDEMKKKETCFSCTLALPLKKINPSLRMVPHAIFKHNEPKDGGLILSDTGLPFSLSSQFTSDHRHGIADHQQPRVGSESDNGDLHLASKIIDTKKENVYSSGDGSTAMKSVAMADIKGSGVFDVFTSPTTNVFDDTRICMGNIRLSPDIEGGGFMSCEAFFASNLISLVFSTNNADLLRSGGDDSPQASKPLMMSKIYRWDADTLEYSPDIEGARRLLPEYSSKYAVTRAGTSDIAMALSSIV